MKKVKVYPVNRIPEIHFFGRNTRDVGQKKFRTLFWNGSGFEVHFKGQELWAEVESDFETMEPYLVVFLNGRMSSRQMLEKGKRWICLSRGTDMSHQSDVLVMKDSQPMADDPRHVVKIHRLALSNGGTFERLPERKLKIEFIGDSITSGEGLCGAIFDTEWISNCMSFCKTYAFQTAQKLNADFRVMSQGGYGVVSGWDNCPYKVIPPHYENVCSVVKGSVYEQLGGNEAYDFSSWQPDFVVINLGTNDRGSFYQDEWNDAETGHSYKMNLDESGKPCKADSEKIASGVKNFLSVIRTHNPDAKIIWATGFMPIPEVMESIYNGVRQYRTFFGDKNIFTLEFDSMNFEISEEDRGSRSHPGPKTHGRAAEKLCHVIRALQ